MSGHWEDGGAVRPVWCRTVEGKNKRGRAAASLSRRGETREGKWGSARCVTKEGVEGGSGSILCDVFRRWGVPGQQRSSGGGRGRATREAGEQREERGPGTWAIMGWQAWPARNEQ
jgi:hypothetical protein